MLYNIELTTTGLTDPLTTLYNRRRMEEVLENHITANPDENFCIAIGDIDFFKKINDTYGHNCGDQVLNSLAELFKKKRWDRTRLQMGRRRISLLLSGHES